MANQYQSIDPTLVAKNTLRGVSPKTKKTVPAVSTTGTPIKPSLNPISQQPQATPTTVPPMTAQIGGISSPFGAPNINNTPVLGGATPKQIETTATQLQSLPKEIPKTGSYDLGELSEKEIKFMKVIKDQGGDLDTALQFIQEKRGEQGGQQALMQGGVKGQVAPQTIDRVNPIMKTTPGAYNPLKTAVNLAPSTLNVAIDIANMALSPVQTAKSLIKLISGVGSKIGKEIGKGVSGMSEEEYNDARDKIISNGGVLGKIYEYAKGGEQQAGAIGEYLKGYGNAEELQRRVEEDPMSVISDLASLVQGGAPLIVKTAKVAGLTKVANTVNKVNNLAIKYDPYVVVPKAAVKGVGKVASIGADAAIGVLGKMTGTSSDTIRQIYKSAAAGSDEAVKGLRGEIDDTAILENVKQGVESIKEDRRLLYGKDLEVLKSNKKPIDIRQIAGETLRDMNEDLGVTFDAEGKLDFSQSKITSSAAQGNLQSIIDDFKNREDTTPNGLDIFRQRIKDYARYTPEFAKSDRFATMVSNKIKAKIIEQVPQYESMMKNYEEVSNLLSDIKSAISVGGKAGTSTIVTKLKSILRDNQEFRKAMVQKIEEYSGKDIQGQIAGLQMSPIVPKGLAGAIGVGAGAIVGLLSQITNPGVLIPLLLSSPRLIGEFANALGVSVSVVNKYIDKFRSLTKPNGNNPTSSTMNTLSTKLPGAKNRGQTVPAGKTT